MIHYLFTTVFIRIDMFKCRGILNPHNYQKGGEKRSVECEKII